jgi:GH18 family chitinase
MLRRILSTLVLGLALGATQRGETFSVAAYLPEWRYEGANWDTIAQHVSHLILFSLEIGDGGKIIAKDRIPRKELLQQAQVAAAEHNTKLLICFGGNGRSAGFSAMVADKASRKRFVKDLVTLCKNKGFHGVDINWEYPGYEFGKGYLPEAEIQKDYEGLRLLLGDIRRAFDRFQGRRIEAGQIDFHRWVITLAYYPDGRQEPLFAAGHFEENVDLFHMMSYDQPQAHHSTLDFGKQAVALGKESLPAKQLTMGLPFYGRHQQTGDWVTYEDIVQQHHPLSPDLDTVQTGYKLSRVYDSCLAFSTLL